MYNTDKAARSCEEPEYPEAAALLQRVAVTPESPGKEDDSKRGGRELRPPKPSKASEEVPREMLRARLPGAAAKKREREEEETKVKGKGGRSPKAPGGGGSGKCYMGMAMGGRASTRIAVHEEGVWRFQPAVRRAHCHHPLLLLHPVTSCHILSRPVTHLAPSEYTVPACPFVGQDRALLSLRRWAGGGGAPD